MSELELIEIARQRAEAEVAPARAAAFERALRELRASSSADAHSAGAPADPDEDGLWTVEEAAAFLGLHPNTVYRKAKEGDLPSVTIGARTLRFEPAALRDYTRRGGTQPVGQLVAFKRRSES